MGNKNAIRKFTLTKDDKEFIFEIENLKHTIRIKCDDYLFYVSKYKLPEEGKKAKTVFANLNKYYNYLIKIFQNKKVSIKKIIEYDSIFLDLNLKKEIYEIILPYKIRIIMSNHSKRFIIKDSYVSKNIDNTFTLFKSYIVYSIKDNGISCFDIIKNQTITNIRNAHKENITNFRYCYDEKNKIDLIMSVSFNDNNIKIWNFKNWECILNLTNINKEGNIYSSCFLKDNNQIFIVTSIYISTFNSNSYNEAIKIFNLNGKYLESIYSSQDITFIDSYYDDKSKNIYIIIGNRGSIQSYVYKGDYSYIRYYDYDNNHTNSIIIKSNEDPVKLINSGDKRYVHIWDFYSGILLKTIKMEFEIFGICLWNYNTLYVGCDFRRICAIDIERGKAFDFCGTYNITTTLKVIYIPEYGKYLVAQGDAGFIFIWKT